MNKNLTLIDADSICYLVGSCETLQEAIVKVDERIDNIVSNTNADYISLFISKGKYFRHDIYPEYKGNRKGLPPKWMRSIKSYLEEKYEANWMAKAEADDLVAYWTNQIMMFYKMKLEDGGFQEAICPNSTYLKDLEILEANEDLVGINEWSNVNIIMAAIDKDLLESIPGKHWNYTFKATDEAKIKKKTDPEYNISENEMIKGWWIETSNKLGQCEIFKAKQLLLGDTSDNVLGCANKIEKIYKTGVKIGQSYLAREGVKPKEAEVIIANVKDNLDCLIPDIFEVYLNRFGNTKGIFEFQKNYRLLHMLDCDEDFLREVGELPKFPKIIKIERIEGEELLNF